MNPAQPGPPRFVPTLTEIVRPGELAHWAPAAPPVAYPASPTPKQAAAPSREIEQRLELDCLVRGLVAEQIEALRLDLRSEIQSSVRDAVAAALMDLKSDHELK